jgi:phosphatidylglycerophosphate synthase
MAHPEAADSQRNSGLRTATQGLRHAIAVKIAEYKITADQITEVGALARITMAVVGFSEGLHSETDLRRRTLNTACHSLAAATDAIDGEVARVSSQKKSKYGAKIDGAADTATLIVEHALQAISAHKRGDHLATATSLLALATCRVPAYFRQEAAGVGKPVKEIDANPLTIGGNQVVRSAASIAETNFPEISGVVNLWLALSNIFSGLKRHQIAVNPNVSPTLKPEEVAAAPEMKQMYALCIVISASLAACLAVSFSRDQK